MVLSECVLSSGYEISHLEGDFSHEWVSISDDAYVFVLCCEGELVIKQNARLFSVEKNSLFFCVPNGEIEWRSKRRGDYIFFKVSSKFFKANLLSGKNLITMQKAKISPAVRLGKDECGELVEIVDFVDKIIGSNDDSNCAYNSNASAIKMLWYECFRFMSLVPSESVHYDENCSYREIDLCTRFLELLFLNYEKEHSVNFYARELCITPQYLSIIIKNITGITSREWIQRVIVEDAICDLKYSKKTMKEIAGFYNFSDQSAFGKFFKRLVGLSPIEYRHRYYEEGDFLL